MFAWACIAGWPQRLAVKASSQEFLNAIEEAGGGAFDTAQEIGYFSVHSGKPGGHGEYYLIVDLNNTLFSDGVGYGLDSGFVYWAEGGSSPSEAALEELTHVLGGWYRF